MNTSPSSLGVDAESAVQETSVWSKILNMFAAPREVFEELRASEASSVANWLTPTFLMALLAVTSAFVLFSQPAIVQAVLDQQTKQFEKQVAEKKMTADQANGARIYLEKTGATLFKITGSIAGAVGSGIGLLVMSTVVLTLVSFLSQEKIGFGKAMEIAALSSCIQILATIVGLCLISMKGHLFATLSPGLFISDFDPENKAHLWAANINLMSFWYLAVLSLGISVVGQIKWAKAAVPVFGLWLAYRLIVISKGWAATGM
ncbi:MAG TPA: YIP1 family protein [Methylomirabilota bacterium]|nr:YIP1 family protein [Methylomirabilota bacterium]